MSPQAIPNPEAPKPEEPPIEIDSGGLHSKPEVDYGSAPSAPAEPGPEIPPVPDPERERETPAPDTEPG